MRKVGQLGFVGRAPDGDSPAKVLERVERLIASWISGKGDYDEPGGTVRYRDGRIATVRRDRTESSLGVVGTWTIAEPTAGGRFETALAVGCSDTEVAVGCALRAGSPEDVLAPIEVDPRTPGIVRDVLDLPYGWSLRSTPVGFRPLPFRGTEGGDAFAEILGHADRALPIVAVSQWNGLILHPGLPADMARDLTAIATVCELDDDASWRLSARLGRPWSCYNGAIRLYWPVLDGYADPFFHPLWTSQRLLTNVSTTKEAADRIRSQIRRRLLAVSALTLRHPDLIGRILEAHREEERAARERRATDEHDYEELAELYAAENEALRRDNERLQESLRQLREQLYRTQIEAAWSSPGRDTEVAPDASTPPETVEEAVAQAKRLLADRLTFGLDVDRGVGDLAPDAGPPEKILSYLEVLADLTTERRHGALGDTMAKWLKDRNVTVSGESASIRRSRSEMERRTWGDGSSRRRFETHLKPSDGTSPERCVRIYFDWDDVTQKIVIGWIGRHP